MDRINTASMSSSRIFPLIRGRAVQSLVFLLLIVGLCAGQLLLIQQNRELKAELARMDKERFMQLGAEVPRLGSRTLHGEEKSVDFSRSEKTVLLVFQPQCPACEQVVPFWRRIQTASETRQYQVFGISLGEITSSAAFLSSNGLRLDTFVDIDATTKALYKLELTPLTIVIDKTGKVEKIWPGAFNRETKPDVESYFGISVADEAK
jgi:peroxiredoxin